MAILSMVCAYVLMCSVPLIARFAIDTINAFNNSDSFDISPIVKQASTLFSSTGEDPGMFQYLMLSATMTIILTAAAGSFLYLRGRFTARGSESVVRALRDQIFSHLEHLPTAFHDKANTGDLVQRCTSDIETLRVFLSNQIVEISRAILLFLTVLPILFYLDSKMAWLSLASMPFLFVYALYFFRKVKNLFLIVDESEAEMTSTLQENLTGIRVVRAFARQDFEIHKFAEKNAAFRDHNTRLISLLGIYYGISDLICMGQMGVLLVFGALWTIEGSLTIGTLFAFLTYEGMVIWPIRHLGRVLTDSGKAIVAMGRLGEILQEPIESHNDHVAELELNGDINFSGICFQFERDKQVLNDISFEIGSGQTLGLVGPPGSGKSTITQLLLRLYDYDTGSICIDGMELNQINRKQIRSLISIVQQEPFLYSASIGANLQVGRLNASFEDLTQAARDASIHDDILDFPRGYDSMVGERGVTLSGGQRQRIALARAILKNPTILVLDDALSAVDTETERKILDALKSNRKKQTTIIVTHRLSSVLHADKIIVLRAGEIEQIGTHQELATKDGIYQRLCKIQGAIQYQLENDLMDATVFSSEAEGSLDYARDDN